MPDLPAPDRAAIRTVTCPICDAPPGQPCIGLRRERIAHHSERLVEATKLEHLLKSRPDWTPELRPCGCPHRTAELGAPILCEHERRVGLEQIARIRADMAARRL